MIKKRGFGVSTVYHLYTESRTYRLELWEQPLHRWLIAQAYHWYDMRVFKMPGFKALENFIERRHKGDPLLYLPLSARQDCRCYDLMVKQRVVLASIEVSEDVRNRVHRKDSYFLS